MPAAKVESKKRRDEARATDAQEEPKPTRKISAVLRTLSNKKLSWRRQQATPVPQHVESPHDGDSTTATAGDDESSMALQHVGTLLLEEDSRSSNSIVSEKLEKVNDMEKEVEELISAIVVGFDGHDIEKELNDDSHVPSKSSTTADYTSTETQQAAVVGFLSAWMETFFSYGGCANAYGGYCANVNDDEELQAVHSIHSLHTGKRKDGLDEPSNEEQEVPLVKVSSDEDSMDDESLASEYDDFNKAMMMLKNRAARHRISQADLLKKIQTEQTRRMSLGLTPSMVEM